MEVSSIFCSSENLISGRLAVSSVSGEGKSLVALKSKYNLDTLPSDHKKTILSPVQIWSTAMRYSSQVKPISYLKANAAEVLARLAELREPMVITQNGEAKAVLQDVASFEETQETLALLKTLALGNQDVAAGKVKPVADVVARLRIKRAPA
jgi:prevent-host-death family protein